MLENMLLSNVANKRNPPNALLFLFNLPVSLLVFQAWLVVLDALCWQSGVLC